MRMYWTRAKLCRVARFGKIRCALRWRHESPHRLAFRNPIKEQSHFARPGGPPALKRELESRKPGQRVQVEVRNQRELEEALADGAEAILLDNMSPQQVNQSVESHSKCHAGTDGTLDLLPKPAEAFSLKISAHSRKRAWTFISVGALTHSAKAADISMSITAE